MNNIIMQFCTCIIVMHNLILGVIYKNCNLNTMNSQQKLKTDEKVNDNSIDKKQDENTTHMIGDYHTAPAYMKDNEHITHGYRINFDNPQKILKSMFMIHNQSVNIWSHFVPAIIICIVIISFGLIVDRQQIANNMNEYHKQVQSTFEHYSHALSNLTLIEDMKQIKDKTQVQLYELRQNAIQSFGNFTEKVNKNMEDLKSLMSLQVEGLKESVRKNILLNIYKLEQMKNDYEKIIAPTLINQIQQFNNSYVNSFKQHMTRIKQQFDSEDFKYIDILHDTPNPQNITRWPLMVFLFSAFVCLMCSTLFHLFYPMSSKSYQIFSRFDYAGISILIAGSACPPLYYGMYCYSEVAMIYLSIMYSLAVLIFVLSVFEWMHRPQNAKWKAFVYGGFGLFNIFPITHLLLNEFVFNQGDGFSFANSLPYFLTLGASYLVGLYIYTNRCPQRHYPGKFNVCGHSHQIWHMFVVLGVILTYLGALQVYEMRKNNVCPVPKIL